MDSQTESNESLTCRNCQTTVSKDDFYCTQCGFPLKGTENEQGKFLGKSILRKREVEEARRKVRQARNTLFVIAALVFISGFILYAHHNQVVYIFAMLILLLIYLGLGFWANTRPFAAIFTGCVLYITLLVLDGIVDPHTIYRGIIVKIIIIGFLVRGTVSAWKAKELLKEDNRKT